MIRRTGSSAGHLDWHGTVVAGRTASCQRQSGTGFWCRIGVVAIAAKMAGAKRVICCDIDQVSLNACRANAELNDVELEYLDDLYKAEQVDILLAADVLYDQCNRFFLDEFLKFAPEVWVADSRVKNFSHPQYLKLDERSATTGQIWMNHQNSAMSASIELNNIQELKKKKGIKPFLCSVFMSRYSESHVQW